MLQKSCNSENKKSWDAFWGNKINPGYLDYMRHINRINIFIIQIKKHIYLYLTGKCCKKTMQSVLDTSVTAHVYLGLGQGNFEIEGENLKKLNMCLNPGCPFA